MRRAFISWALTYEQASNVRTSTAFMEDGLGSVMKVLCVVSAGSRLSPIAAGKDVVV